MICLSPQNTFGVAAKSNTVEVTEGQTEIPPFTDRLVRGVATGEAKEVIAWGPEVSGGPGDQLSELVQKKNTVIRTILNSIIRYVKRHCIDTMVVNETPNKALKTSLVILEVPLST